MTVKVALRKESVDRNIFSCYYNTRIEEVALRKESVDRNTMTITTCTASKKSLSARRAWIEIFGGVSARPLAPVALRKESVDRNV